MYYAISAAHAQVQKPALRVPHPNAGAEATCKREPEC